MFIDRGARPLRFRSEERQRSGVEKLYLNSAPPNGIRIVFLARVYKHLTPNGVKTVVDNETFSALTFEFRYLEVFWSRPWPRCEICG